MTHPQKIALLYPGDRAARLAADPVQSRFAALFAAFEAAGVQAVPVIWHDDFADEVRQQLLQVHAVLVWCNPIEDGKRRDVLDTVLREVAVAGVAVSTHPDVILKLGTKDVLVQVRGLPFGSDAHRVDSLAQLELELPTRLAGGARVLKQHRGHSGIGVWRVEAAGNNMFELRHAARGSEGEQVDMAGLLERLSPYFEPSAGGHMIDQDWQPLLVNGMVRAYMVEDKLAGFGTQAVNALHPDNLQPGPRLYHGPHGTDLAEHQALRHLLEFEWVALLADRLNIAHTELPLLWDCDFIAREGGGYVLCEINVSSVSPFPPSAVAPLVAATLRRVQGIKNAS